MDDLWEKLLTCAALACDEHREVYGCHLDGPGYGSYQRGSLADYAKPIFSLLHFSCELVLCLHIGWGIIQSANIINEKGKIRIKLRMDNFGKGVKVRRNTFVESFEPYK